MARRLNNFALYTPRPLSEDGKYLEVKSNSILASITVYLRGRLPNLAFNKINLMINANSPQPIGITDNKILYIYKSCDLKNFQSLSIEKQKEQIMQLGFSCLVEIFEHSNIDPSILEGCEEHIIANDYSNLFYGPIAKSEGFSYRVCAHQGFDETNLFVVVKKGRKEVRRVHFLTIPETNPFAFNIYLSDLEIKQDKVILQTYKDKHILELSS